MSIRNVVIVCLFALGIGCSNTKPPVSEQFKPKHDVFPEAIGYLNDFEGILDSIEHAKLDSTLTEIERSTSNEIAIVTIKEIAPYDSIFNYSLDLARYWGVGKKELNNGVLIAVSKNLRKMHIQNGTGIENRITNEETKMIIDSLIIPEFKQDNYYLGLMKGVEGIMDELN